MRKLLTLFTVLLISVFAFAQNPKLSYQAVVRDGQNKLVVEQPVTVTVNVLDAANASQFAQTLNATTNRNGLMSLEIGDETDAWNNINWVGAKIRTAITLADGNQFVDTTIVNAVPFALYANSVPDEVLDNLMEAQSSQMDALQQNLDSLSNLFFDHAYLDGKPCPLTNTISDGTNSYPTVVIGKQCWMAQNLRTTAGLDYRDDYFHVNNNENNDEEYGLLYTWYATTHSQAQDGEHPMVKGICPEGWHIPSIAEWNTMTSYINSRPTQFKHCGNGNIASTLASKTRWSGSSDVDYSPAKDLSANNITGFNILPAGIYYNYASGYGTSSYFWSSSELAYNYAYHIRFFNNNATVINDNFDMNGAFSVRCLRNTAVVSSSESASTTTSCDDVTTCINNAIDVRGYLTSDSAVITTMQGDIAANATNITTNAANISTNTANITTNTANIESLASRVNTFNTNVCDSVASCINNAIDARGFLTSDSAVITTMQGDIVTNATNIATNAANISAAINKEKADSANLAARIDALENASLDCTDVKHCISDTLSKYTTTEQLCSVVNNCDLSSNAAIANLSALIQGLSDQMEAINGKMDSLNHLVDSLSNQLPTPVYPSFTCGHYTVKDHEGNMYNTVKIGNQCWTKENMRCITSPSTGSTILEYPASSYSFTGKKAYYLNGNASNMTEYGLLYNWYAAVDTFNTTYEETSTNTDFEQALSVTFTGNRRGICPKGWHVPSKEEWTQLRNYMVSHRQYWCQDDSTYIAKALASSTGWCTEPNDCGVGNSQNNNNASGFTALPTGFYTNGYFNFGYYAHFWSASQSYGYFSALLFQIDYHHPDVNYQDSGKDEGASVRCLRDAGISGNTGDNEAQSSATSMSCDEVMNCLGDTLGRLNAKIEAQNAIIDSLYHMVDSLTNLASDTIPTPEDIDGQPCLEAPTVSDGTNTYKTVKLGTQCWMAENMRRAKKTNGEEFPYGERYCPGKSITAYCDSVNTYGYLYTWYAANEKSSYSPPSSNVRGICPEGWHIPTDDEWETLISYVKSVSEYQCGENSNYIGKALASKTGWNSDGAYDDCLVAKNQEDNNATGFNAYPAGDYDSGFSDMGYYANFWSANFNAYQLYGGRKTFRKWDSVSSDASLSVRCLKD